MRDRRTGEFVGPIIPIKPADNFYHLPRLNQRVWRYMEYWKFEHLVKHEALYFRRSDRLEDDMEANTPKPTAHIPPQSGSASFRPTR